MPKLCSWLLYLGVKLHFEGKTVRQQLIIINMVNMAKLRARYHLDFEHTQNIFRAHDGDVSWKAMDCEVIKNRGK